MLINCEPMEDFGFKLQSIKSKYGLKKILKALLVLLSILFIVLIFVKIVKILSNDNYENIDNIPLIKSEIQAVKKLPEQEGGLVVDNLDVSVYDVIDSNNEVNNNPIIKKTKQDISLQDNLNNNTSLEQDMLAQKIGAISHDNGLLENDNSTKTMLDGVDHMLISGVPSQTSKVNIQINNNERIPTTNVDDLQQLGNKSLVKNLKEKKDIKPGIKVQLLALKSKDALIKYWDDLNKRHRRLFSDKNYYIEQVNLNNVGVMYRLKVGNFKDRESADKFCIEYVKLTNKSKVDCIVMKD